MNTRVVERSVLYYTNRERSKRGLRKLSGHRSLKRAARHHSRWMSRSSRYSHSGVHGSRPWERAKWAGYPSQRVGENIWTVSSGSGGTWRSRFKWRSDWQLGKAAVISWMNSKGHRRNLLNPDWNHLGVGVARNRSGRVYLTQNFGGATVLDSPLMKPVVWLAGLGLMFLMSGGLCWAVR